MPNEPIEQTGIYRRKGERPFRLVIDEDKNEYGVMKRFEDGEEPLNQILFKHDVSRCLKCFEIRKISYDKLYETETLVEDIIEQNGNDNENENRESD